MEVEGTLGGSIGSRASKKSQIVPSPENNSVVRRVGSNDGYVQIGESSKQLYRLHVRPLEGLRSTRNLRGPPLSSKLSDKIAIFLGGVFSQLHGPLGTL